MRSLGLALGGLVLMGCSMSLTRPLPPRLPPRSQAEQLVARAEELSRAGSYPEAQEAYRRALEESAQASPADHALFGLARLLTVPENPNRDYRQAYESFERLLREHPQSPWAGEARAWRDVLAALQAQREELSGLRREVERLRQEAQRGRQEVQRIRQDLERLKQLELDLERQRRR